MPNWCENDLFVRGEPEQLQAFVKYAVSVDKSRAFDFNRFVQMPEMLESVQSGSNELYYDAWYGSDERVAELLSFPWVKKHASDRDGLKVLLTKRNPNAEKIANQYRDIREQYGCKTWYDWAIEHWGATWTPADVSTPEIREEGRLVLYRFRTAWSPPLPVIEAASKKFADLRLTLRYYERGVGFKGVFVCKAGMIHRDKQSKYHGRRGG